MPKSPDARARVLAEKDQAVLMWEQLVALARSIHCADSATQDYVESSCQYGLYVYSIYRAGFQIVALGPTGDKLQMIQLIKDYDDMWTRYRQVKIDHPSCGTLYTDLPPLGKRGIGALVDEYRKIAAS